MATPAPTTPPSFSRMATPASIPRVMVPPGSCLRKRRRMWRARRRSRLSKTAKARRSASRSKIVGAQTEAHAREVGRAIARSTLVKTAIYGGDPNWGRVLAAAGVAGVALLAERITLEAQSSNGWLTLASGGATALADPAQARAIFKQKTIRLRLDLGLGRSEAVVWTCDLSPDYVRINSDYTS